MRTLTENHSNVKELYYEGSRIKIFKGDEDFSWNYKVLVDDVEIDKITSIDISICAGHAPVVSITYLDVLE